MKKLLIIMFSLLLITGSSACNPDDKLPPEIPEQPKQPDPEQSNENNDKMKIKVTIGSNKYTATLSDNPTATAFIAMLPMTINMYEHAGNEKYCNLSSNLPTAASNPRTIRNGDIMLFGSSTIVLFYKTFSTAYSYTRIGAIDNPEGLEKALSTGNIMVTLEIAD